MTLGNLLGAGPMPAWQFGIIAGLVLGLISILTMLPKKFRNPVPAFAGAFLSRFAVGFLTPLVALPMPLWASGIIVGALVSATDAFVIRAWPTILLLGAVGGGLTGLLAEWLLA